MKPPLFFIHGMWSTPAVFARLRAGLEGEGWETVAPVLPWHERDPSLPPPAELGRVSLSDYVSFLVAQVERLPAPPVIVGHSMGGLLAQLVAARVAHAGLVLLSPAASSSAGSLDPVQVRTLRRVITQWNWWRQPTKLDAEGARWGVFNGVPDDVATAEIAALTWDSGRVMAEIALPFVFDWKSKVDYARLDRPTLVVVGLDDRTTPSAVARATARQLAGPVDYHELKGVGHWLFWGETERRVGAMLADWLAGLALPEPTAVSPRA